MTPRERAAEMLRKELTDGKMEWYYISVAAETFHCGYVLQGMGPTDAWNRLHGLNVIPPDHETKTGGPIPEDVMAKIPESMGYRKLTREESCNLGK